MRFFLDVTLFIAALALAQEPRPDSMEKMYEGEGRLVGVRVIPGDREAKLFFIGRKAGEARFVPGSRLVSVRGSSDEELHFTEAGDAYLIRGLPKDGAVDLRVQADVHGQRDEIKVQMKNRAP